MHMLTARNAFSKKQDSLSSAPSGMYNSNSRLNYADEADRRIKKTYNPQRQQHNPNIRIIVSAYCTPEQSDDDDDDFKSHQSLSARSENSALPMIIFLGRYENF